MEKNVVITLSDARRVITAAEAKTREIGQPMNIAVVDAGGNLVSHVRMDGAGSVASISRSIRRSRRVLSISRPRSSPKTATRASSSLASTDPTTGV
jgi:uncharacterized protein GlcG (DUF336 family)